MERVPDDPEYNYEHNRKTFCHQCKYYFTNQSPYMQSKLVVTVNGKKKTIRVKYGQIYCTHGEPFKSIKTMYADRAFRKDAPSISFHTKNENADKQGPLSHVLDVAATALAIAGYKILDGDKDTILIRHIGTSTGESDFELKVNEIAG